MSLFQGQLDRMEVSIKSLETRLEDKVGDLRAAVDGKVDGLDSNIETRFSNLNLRMNSLENRLEDKLVHLDTQVNKVLDKTKTAESLKIVEVAIDYY